MNEPGNRLFNNADSFAMAFDEAWEKSKSDKNTQALSPEHRAEMVLATLNEHPFTKESPEKAKQVAQFRIRLLNLL